MMNSLLAPVRALQSGVRTGVKAGAAPAGDCMPIKVLAVYCVLAIVALMATTLPSAKDYVGNDNDDVMRLVMVRDLLAGQGWFDTMQYRLGPNGTLMHWSRFIDLPLANLIAFFSLFLSATKAEAVALTVWPLLMVLPLFYGMGLAGFRLGGRPVMHAVLILSGILILTMNRFQPGSIDHHNLQLALIAIVVAMLLDPAHRRRSLSVAGFCAGFAIAIGAETMPLIATFCAVVALLWCWHGEKYAAAAQAFGLSLAATVTAAFFLTVPPQAYSTVTCDNLSLGFYSLAAFGGGFLFLASALFSRAPLGVRVAALGGIGILVGAAALVIAPQCLQNPLNALDPMLVELWLNGVSEAQSVTAFFSNDIQFFATYYAVGLLGILVCIHRIFSGRMVEAHIVMLGLIGVCYGVGLIQVRGTVFATTLSTIVLARAIIDARRLSNANPKNIGRALAFIALTLGSVPAAWAVAGLAIPVEEAGKTASETAEATVRNDCESAEALAGLSRLPPGLVASPSDSGVEVLRYSRHRALTAPYHRNQAGMLTELHIGLARPNEAEAFIRGAGVTILAFCAADSQTQRLMKMAPEGLYAELAAGHVPDYLRAEPDDAKGGVKLFTVKQP